QPLRARSRRECGSGQQGTLGACKQGLKCGGSHAARTLPQRAQSHRSRPNRARRRKIPASQRWLFPFGVELCEPPEPWPTVACSPLSEFFVALIVVTESGLTTIMTSLLF